MKNLKNFHKHLINKSLVSKRVIVVLLVIATFASCNQQEKKETTDNSFTITVTGEEHFSEGARVAIYRQKTVESPERVEFLAKDPFKDGKFKLEGTVDEVHIVALDILPKDDDHPYHRVVFPLEPGDIAIDFIAEKKYKFEGGHYGDLIVNSVNDNKDYTAAWDAMLNYNVTDHKDSLQMNEYMNRVGRVNDLQRELLEKVYNSNQDDPLAQLLLHNAGYYGDQRIDRNAVIEGLVAKVGADHRQSKVAMLGVKSRREIAAARATVGIGTIIKDFESKNLKGETFHLANVLKENKYVLVEFWASWCGPCRGEIPHMKKAYSHYNEKGFEIVSFSLDDKKERWEKASKQEQIPWIDTGDLLAYTSPVVKMYGISGIPANYLVEAATGKIIAKDLRQEKLDNKLEELLGK